ncbi:hypothetical protein [Paraglaciecola sp. 20A4]|uniref:hypothetical protein n=1 Tax=Paraglaciecola sp. 20A4 TaxID=2687288 RepID=UPI0014078E25|nr:hypothetical protein [Paraglaciecola sp. 20A4]
MKQTLIFIIFSTLFLSACSTPYGYHSPAPDTCDGAPGCAVSAVVSGLLKTTPSKDTKCADMRGERKAACDAQVSALKASIENAKRQ